MAAVVAAATLWAVSAAVARDLFDAGVSPVELTEARAFIATVGFALIPHAWRRPARSRWREVVGLGLAIALVNLTYYVAVSRIPVAVALVLEFTAPVLVVAWTSAVRRKAPSAEVLAALVAATVGVVLVVELLSGDLGRMDGLGVAMGLASSVFFALYAVLAERTGAAYGAMGAMLRAFAVATLVWVAYQAPRGVPATLLAGSNLPRVLYVGVLGTLVPFFLFVWGVQHVRAERAAIAATLEPAVAAVVAWIWLGQNLSAMQISGGVLVIGAVASLQVRRRRPVVAPEV